MATTFRAAQEAITANVDRIENIQRAAHLAWTYRTKDDGAVYYGLMKQLQGIAVEELNSSIPNFLQELLGYTPTESSVEKGLLKEAVRRVLLKGINELPWDSAELALKDPYRVDTCLDCLETLAERLGMREEALRIAERKLPHVVDQTKRKDVSTAAQFCWLLLNIYGCPSIGSGTASLADGKLQRVELMAERVLRAMKSGVQSPSLRKSLWARLASTAYDYLGEDDLLRIQAEILKDAIPWVTQDLSPSRVFLESLPIILADALIWEGRLSEAEKVICRYETKEATYRALADLRLAFIAFERGDDKRTAEVAHSVYNVLCKDVSCDAWGYSTAVMLMHWGTKHPKKLHGLMESLCAESMKGSRSEMVSEPDEYGISCERLHVNLEDGTLAGGDGPRSANYCIKLPYTILRMGGFVLELRCAIQLRYAEWELELHRVIEARGQSAPAIDESPLAASKLVLLLREASASWRDEPHDYSFRTSWSRRLELVQARALLLLVDYLGKLGQHDEVERLRGDLDMPSNQDILRRAREEMRSAPKPDVKGYLQKRARKQSKKLRRKQRQAAAGGSAEESGAQGSGTQEEEGGGGGKSGVETEEEDERRAAEAQEEEEEEECAICFFDLSTEAEGNVTLGCRHVLHRTCLDGWVHMCRLHSRAPTCPMCRVAVDESA
jgi:hypothetical protein